MNTTITSVSALVTARASQATKKVETQKPLEQKQQTEAYSSTYSNAARSLAMAGINFSKPAEKAEGVNYTEGINCTVVKETTGDETNKWWQEEMDYDNPPYLPKSKVQEIELQEDTKFCRVYDGVNSGMFGGWVMKQTDIEGLTPEEIQDKFALPQKPFMMCDVTLPKGTHMRTGLCNPLEGWGKGGGVQFDLMGQRVGSFDNERDLPTKKDIKAEG